MALKIDQTWAQIGLKTTLPQFKLQIREPQLKVNQELPQVQLRQQPAQVNCDASQCRADMGLYTPLEAGRLLARKGMQESTAYIGQVARNGDMMAKIEKYDISDVMAYLGAQAFEEPEFNVALVPKSRVDIEVTPGAGDRKLKRGRVRLEPRLGDVSFHLNRGKVDIYLRQKPSIRIQYIGERIDTYR